MIILKEQVTVQYLNELAQNFYGEMIKAVADVDKGLIALDAELHSDLERMLLENGSSQESLWGFNIYPQLDGDDFIEFDSLINIRPRQNNRSRDVENPAIREEILSLVGKFIKK